MTFQPDIALKARQTNAQLIVRLRGLFQILIRRSTSSMSHFNVRTRYTIISTFLIFVLIITVTTSYLLQIPQSAHARPVQAGFNHFLSTHYDDDGQYDDNNLLAG